MDGMEVSITAVLGSFYFSIYAYRKAVEHAGEKIEQGERRHLQYCSRWRIFRRNLRPKCRGRLPFLGWSAVADLFRLPERLDMGNDKERSSSPRKGNGGGSGDHRKGSVLPPPPPRKPSESDSGSSSGSRSSSDD